MNDSILTQGLLSRLDVITSKMGVGATQLWDLWTATSWRALLGVGFLLLFAVISGVLSVLTMRMAQRANSDAEDLLTLLFLAAAGVSIVCACAALLNASEAVAYIIEPRLYALDQLRELVGR